MSGLTVGYLSIDDLILELKTKTGSEDEKHQCKQIKEILEKRHLLLVTLLVSNAAAMETLPLCLNEIVTEVLAVLISVTAVLIFGEIIPQALCTGPSQFQIAAAVAPVTYCLMWMEGIIAYPISKVLDCVLGEHCVTRYKNSDLKALIELHSQNALLGIELDPVQNEGMGLYPEQAHMIQCAIDSSSKTVGKIMKNYALVKKIDANQPLTKEFFEDLIKEGYSRYPVYKGDPKKIIGILLVKRLLGFKSFGKTLMELHVKLRKPLVCKPDKKINDILMEFKKGKSHMAIITNQIAEFKKNFEADKNACQNSMLNFSEMMDDSNIEILGIVTLEDIVEALIGG
jgi:CBS domain containing-hemolysin-like protein